MKDLILQYLQENGTVKRRDLLRYLHTFVPDCNDRKMRAAIQSMIVTDGYCIESSYRGYNLITSDAHYVCALDYLSKKSVAIAVRKNCLIRNYARQNEKQTKLFL